MMRGAFVSSLLPHLALVDKRQMIERPELVEPIFQSALGEMNDEIIFKLAQSIVRRGRGT